MATGSQAAGTLTKARDLTEKWYQQAQKMVPGTVIIARCKASPHSDQITNCPCLVGIYALLTGA